MNEKFHICTNQSCKLCDAFSKFVENVYRCPKCSRLQLWQDDNGTWHKYNADPTDWSEELTKLNSQNQVKQMKSIDLTPTWRGILPILVEVALNGSTPESRKDAMDELYKLADIVDKIVAEKKATK